MHHAWWVVGCFKLLEVCDGRNSNFCQALWTPQSFKSNTTEIGSVLLGANSSLIQYFAIDGRRIRHQSGIRSSNPTIMFAKAKQIIHRQWKRGKSSDNVTIRPKSVTIEWTVEHIVGTVRKLMTAPSKNALLWMCDAAQNRMDTQNDKMEWRARDTTTKYTFSLMMFGSKARKWYSFQVFIRV